MVLFLSGYGVSKPWTEEDHTKLNGDVESDNKHTLNESNSGDICIYHCGLLKPSYILDNSIKGNVANLILVVDCCYAGGWETYFKKWWDNLTDKESVNLKKIAIHTSCSSDEVSYGMRFIPALLKLGIPFRAVKPEEMYSFYDEMFDLTSLNLDFGLIIRPILAVL